jgi:hypothetical protein
MRSTSGQLKDFEESVVWQDIKEELGIWLTEIRDQLENSDMQFSSRVLDQLGGSAKALRMVQMIPEVLRNLAEDEEDERLRISKELKGGRNA